MKRRWTILISLFLTISFGPAYKKSVLENESPGVYVARVKSPPSGWTAFFVELDFESGGDSPLRCTTQVHIVPDVLPHDIEEFRKTIK